jgi:exodeoxyribonuclease VII small subunit
MAKISFEKAMAQLENIVHELETGELPLEEALKQFEEGIKLSKLCTAKLEESEKKIKLLMEQADGSINAFPYDNQDGDAEA